MLTRETVTFYDAAGKAGERDAARSRRARFLVDKGNFRHFMAKEIHEQPEVVGRTLSHYLDLSAGGARLPFDLPFDPKKLSRVTISACGTAYYAGLIAQILDRALCAARRSTSTSPRNFAIARRRCADGGLMIVRLAIGRDRRHARRAALRQGARAAHSLHRQCRRPRRSRARATRRAHPAGPEIGVASTKAFTCQLAVLAASP